MLTQTQVEKWHEDGFIVIEQFLTAEEVRLARSRFEPLFRGEFATGLAPDEWNWREGRDPPDDTRQICNGWKSDPVVAGVVLKPEIGRICATLGGWPGARIGQDNVIWKPPGAKPLGYHQDDSCGSHRWGKFPPIRQFHAPDDYREALKEAAASVGQEVDIAYVEVPAGGCAVHSGRTWHGSDSNRTGQPRRSLVTHCISSDCRFHPTEVSHIYSRYKRVQDDTMDESFFPILWSRTGYRTPHLDARGAVSA